MKKTRNDRLRLLGDRLCYLAEGMEGLRRRRTMKKTIPGYSDEYDLRARVLLAGEQEPAKRAEPTAKTS